MQGSLPSFTFGPQSKAITERCSGLCAAACCSSPSAPVGCVPGPQLGVYAHKGERNLQEGLHRQAAPAHNQRVPGLAPEGRLPRLPRRMQVQPGAPQQCRPSGYRWEAWGGCWALYKKRHCKQPDLHAVLKSRDVSART
jgi:hypothetical protein